MVQTSEQSVLGVKIQAETYHGKASVTYSTKQDFHCTTFARFRSIESVLNPLNIRTREVQGWSVKSSRGRSNENIYLLSFATVKQSKAPF